jgi:hypothetical protein
MTKTVPRPKLTDVPEKVIAQYAKMLGIDDIEVIDRLVIRGDNILISLRGLVDDGDVEWGWVWSREDEEDFELDELDDLVESSK